MATLYDVIHRALLNGLAKHGESKYGIIAQLDPVSIETRITGIYKLQFLAEDVAKAVQAKLDADAAATKETANASLA